MSLSRPESGHTRVRAKMEENVNLDSADVAFTLIYYQTSRWIKASQRIKVIMIQMSEEMQLVTGALTELEVCQVRETKSLNCSTRLG